MIEAYTPAGKPIIHFLSALTEKQENISYEYEGIQRIDYKYREAINNTRQFNGKAYDTKAFGGGIVFPSESFIDKFKEWLNKENSQ
jgi:hypothetical protein